MTKTKILFRLLLILLLSTGANRVWGYTVLYERGTSGHEWTSANLSDFTTTNCTLTLESYGAQISTSNTTAYAAKSISPQAGSTLFIEAEWLGMSNTGRAYSTGNASYFRFGNIYILENDQDQSSAYSLTAYSGSNYTTFAGPTGWRTYDATTRPFYIIKMEINTFTNTLNYLRVYSSSNTSTPLLNIENQTLTDYDYTTIGFGYVKVSSMGTTQVEILKSIKVTETPALEWSNASASISLTSVGTNNFNTVTGLPTLTTTGFSGTVSYSSDNEHVAKVNNSTGQVALIGTGTAYITASGAGVASASYKLTVTGSNASTNTTTSISSGTTTKTWSLASEGVMPRGGVADLGAITMSYGINTEMGVAVNDGGTYVMKVVDANGYSHAAINGTTHLPDNASYGGTYYTFRPAANGTLTINGKLNKPRLYNSDGTELVNNDNNETSVTANLTANNVYYFYCEPYDLAYLSSFSFTYQAYLTKSYDVVPSTQSSYTLPAVEGFTSPSYSIVGTTGEISTSDVSISGTTISGFYGKPGAVKVSISEGGTEFYFVLTVAYPATPYPGKLWDFNQYYESGYQPPLSIDENGYSGRGFPRIDANADGTVNLTNTEGGSANITDEHGDAWVAELKNVNNGSGRDARWQHVNPVHGDNAFIVSETAGLVFNTGGKGFFVRNDRVKYNCWGHVGIRQNGASFTIPQLTAGDIVEINWKRETGGAGGEYTATNVTDLRYKPVSEQFEITGSQNGTTGGVLDIFKNPGYTSFIATGGDVTFTLRDAGATDILSIRIYSGGYRSTMRPITNTSHRAPETSMLLDYQDDAEHNYNYQEYEYDYCNVLNSTNTGPAIYVLKGYRRGEDNVECVSGTNAALSPTPFEDNDATYSAYPVTEAESQRLYDLRKNLMGFRMYNRTWQSSRNSYNNGRVGASGGWGKVTIRMNNYTNDMKYVIGYTNDVTMTFGSAPHQTYPYTWDFSKIAGGTVTGASDNVLYSIGAEGTMETFSGQAPTNWIKKDDGQFMLNTDNNGELGSQYVPGAVLVSTNRALSNFSGAADNKYAKDELDGLGFDGDITMHVDHQPNYSGWSRTTPPDKWNSLLSFKITDVATFVPREGTDPEEHDGTWNYTKAKQAAGNGWIQLNHAGGIDTDNHIDESNIPAGGIGFRVDGGNSKYIRVFLGNTLQKGDVISVTAYNAYNYRDAGISFNKSANSNDYAQRMMLGQRMVEETINYTVTTNDGLDGRNDFYLYMYTNTVHITAIEISRKASSAPDLDWSIYTLSSTTITVPDLNANDKQDWIYVSATNKPTVTNATEVTSGTDGPDANTTPEVNTDIHVYKFKVTNEGDALLTFSEGTKIYKIGVTHILKEIHPVGGTGWATEIRNHSIDHELTGYFTKNDVNAYTVKYDSYDMKTATVALTPINEDGYVPEKTGVVMRLDNIGNLSDANSGKYVPLFYPSYTRPASSTPVSFPTDNWMYNVEEGIDADNRNYNENITVDGVYYTKFILTNVHWLYTLSDQTGQWTQLSNADAAGFHRMHIWNDETLDVMPAHTAYLLVPTDQLPVALWGTFPPSSSRLYTLGIRELDNETTDLTAPRDDNKENGRQCWYTLNGTMLSATPTKPGIYIKNGRKVVVR
ncbi:MAG: hypothetical protein II403_02895 [Prevotella sp.]|nr:hypothetical protein [Prevotella sp.]